MVLNNALIHHGYLFFFYVSVRRVPESDDRKVPLWQIVANEKSHIPPQKRYVSMVTTQALQTSEENANKMFMLRVLV